MKNRIEFKPDEDIVTHSLILVEQNERGIKGKGEYRRSPAIRNLYMNKYEFKMLKALAEKYGVSMQAMIRMMTCTSYLEVALDECPDLSDLFTEAGDQEKTKAVEEKQTPADEDPFVLFDLDEDDLGNAVDEFCFKEDESENDKIKKTLDSLIAAMKKSDDFLKAQVIARGIEVKADLIKEEADNCYEKIKEIMKVSILSGEYMNVVTQEIDEELNSLRKVIFEVVDEVAAINEVYEKLSKHEQEKLVNGIGRVDESRSKISRATYSLIRSCSDLDSDYQDIVGLMDHEDEVLVACKSALEEIIDILGVVKESLPNPLNDFIKELKA